MMQCRGMSENPNHPQGFGQWFEIPKTEDNSYLGELIESDDLPTKCQKLILIDLDDFNSEVTQ